MELNAVNTEPVNIEKIEARLLDLRIAELEIQEQIISKVKIAHERKIWKEAGYPSLQSYCRDELGYSEYEVKDILIRLKLILPSSEIKSEDPVIQMRIEVLKAWRKEESRRRGWAPFRVITNRTLMQLAEKHPKNIRELDEIDGIGTLKALHFGTSLIRVLNPDRLE